jgi:hypothetical protein
VLSLPSRRLQFPVLRSDEITAHNLIQNLTWGANGRSPGYKANCPRTARREAAGVERDPRADNGRWGSSRSTDSMFPAKCLDLLYIVVDSLPDYLKVEPMHALQCRGCERVPHALLLAALLGVSTVSVAKAADTCTEHFSGCHAACVRRGSGADESCRHQCQRLLRRCLQTGCARGTCGFTQS